MVFVVVDPVVLVLLPELVLEPLVLLLEFSVVWLVVLVVLEPDCRVVPTVLDVPPEVVLL